MVSDLTGDEMLSGPRGRRLCAAVAELVDERLSGLFSCAAWSPTDAGARSTVLSALDRIDASAVAGFTDSIDLLGPLADSVAFAMYWQEPDDTDRLLESDDFRAALAPVAQALTAAPAASWWPTGVELAAQHYVGFVHEGPPDAPERDGAADALRRWRTATMDDEHEARNRPEELSAPVSGRWWSAPLGRTALVSTSRAIGLLDAVALVLVEDSLGLTDAQVWPMSPGPGCRIYEIIGPQAWTALVERYPLEVTRSRRHDWWRVTGRTGTWHIPDWDRVSADYDGVHLTVSGYLSTAGRALDLGDTATLLGGWNPDQTFWLTDVIRSAGRPRSWHLNDRNDLASWSPGDLP
jgi:hypothetical protein